MIWHLNSFLEADSVIEGQHSQLVTNRILKKNKANTGWQIYACMANTLVDYLCVALLTFQSTSNLLFNYWKRLQSQVLEHTLDFQ